MTTAICMQAQKYPGNAYRSSGQPDTIQPSNCIVHIRNAYTANFAYWYISGEELLYWDSTGMYENTISFNIEYPFRAAVFFDNNIENSIPIYLEQVNTGFM
jgi:hypothetical protein